MTCFVASILQEGNSALQMCTRTNLDCLFSCPVLSIHHTSLSKGENDTTSLSQRANLAVSQTASCLACILSVPAQLHVALHAALTCSLTQQNQGFRICIHDLDKKQSWITRNLYAGKSSSSVLCFSPAVPTALPIHLAKPLPMLLWPLRVSTGMLARFRVWSTTCVKLTSRCMKGLCPA